MREDRNEEIEEILKKINALDDRLWFLAQGAAHLRDRALLKAAITMWDELDVIFNYVCRLKKR